MGSNGRVEEIVPHFDYFRLGSAAINAQLGKDPWQNAADLASADGLTFFQGRQIYAAELREGALTGGGFARADGGEVTIGIWEHVSVESLN